MYKVYKLTFGERVYIGCTNNIRRRKDQHNGNARTKRSKLGRFLSDNGIRLDVDDFQILYESEDRSKALAYEKKSAIDAEKHGLLLLNDIYSSDCTRKGKNLGHTAKTFVIVDFIEHTVTTVTDLRQYCFKNGLDYKLLHRTSKSGHEYKNRYCAFVAEVWEKEPDKQKYIDGSFVDEIKEKVNDDKIKRMSKCYEVQFPDGHTEIVCNLCQFAREHNLTDGTLHATYTKRKPTKGYKVIRRI